MLGDILPMTPEELALLNELFSSHFGLYFPDHKREILESRLVPRLRANHVQRFIDYYLLLQYDLSREIDALVRAITNNESYFFRETFQFDALEGAPVRELHSEGPRPGTLRALSAGCSSGEEPYTLNIFARNEYRLPAQTVHIDAIDIDTERLDVARRAVYRTSSLRVLSPQQVDRYFVVNDQEESELRPQYREGVHFSTGNILELGRPGRLAPYDLVLCRNVLIYFSEAALKQAIDHFAHIVRPGGMLFLGHSESIIGLTKAFQAVRLEGCIGYRRVSEE